MPIVHKSRTGKTYYLHTGQKRGGGAQYFLSTKSSGTLAEILPAGFEIYETVNGQAYLRRQQPKLSSSHFDGICTWRGTDIPPSGGEVDEFS